MGKTPLGYLSQPVHTSGTEQRPRGVDRSAIEEYWYGRPIKERKAMPRTAVEGPANHARVAELVAAGSKKSDAFTQVAREVLGAGASDEDVTKKSRSISTNFYRIEREGKGGAPAKPAGPKPATKAVANGGYTSDVLSQLGQAEAAITAAITEARNQAAELDALRKFKAGVTALQS
jgi:hypothetical protein